MTSQTSKAHSFTPNANKSEFNCSKPFLCKGIDGSNPAARNLSTFVPVDQSVHWCCLDKKNLPSHSALYALHPFFDTEGMVRVGGRTRESKLAYSKMYPIILDGTHQLTFEQSIPVCCMQGPPCLSIVDITRYKNIEIVML